MKKDDVIETFTLLQTDENTKKIFDADISARIPYRLHCCVYNFNRKVWVEDDILYNYDLGGNCQTLKILNEHGACLMYYQIRPYLRPMSSVSEMWGGLTEEEIENPWILFDSPVDALDYFLTNHIDFRGLIPLGLALEAPEGMYKE